MDKLSGIIPQSSIRFLRDMSGIAPDFHILSSMFEGFRESGRTRPKEPETDKSWSPELWLDYYREQARLEEPLIAMVDAEGLTGISLEKGMKQMIEEREQMDKRMEKQINSYNLMRNRDAAFDTEYPEKFLDLLEIPDVKDEDDPVYHLLKPFTNNVLERLKRDYFNRVKESKNEEDLMRSPLEHYLVILALKPQVRISSCGVMAESVGHEAPRKGVYMFAMECLERIADAIERFSLKHLYPLAAEARNIIKQIEEILTVS